ncbi:ATP-binding cassette subfamily G member 4-like [Bacillus rossius redtenbacheri]|uniref:ATP-binding cassette subfamily G member 4-like n=1 Tax=Bacillus rossius redtenbacheri TaxID=93214 RepID=UPI002FDEE381
MAAETVSLDALQARRKSVRTMGALAYLPDRPLIDIEFSDLSYTIPSGIRGKKIILRSVSGLFRAAQLTAILGPSGAGKSTLLNVLAGYKSAEASGGISINGRPRDLRQFRKLSRYIMQEDLLQPHLSVREAMTISANLKLGHSLSAERKRQVVEHILDNLRLLGASDTCTSRLSGGERKRLSIALELVNNPPVIFLDEPTTGLDDLSSSQCISLLKSLAEEGRTVVCSVHTPSARLFAMFDHVYIVAAGQCVFQGPGGRIVPFLASVGVDCPLHYNPADFVIEVSSGEYGDHTEKMVAAVDNGRCYSWKGIAPSPPEPELPSCSADIVSEGSETSCSELMDISNKTYNFDSSTWMQFRILVYRMMLQTWRNSSYLIMKVVLYLFITFMVTIMFWRMGNDGSKTLFNFGFIYTCIIVFLYIPMLPVLLNFPVEVQLLKREYFNRWYSLNAYFFALTLSRLPLELFLGTTYLACVYITTGQPLEISRYAQFLTICLLTGVSSESLGYAISSTLGIVNSIFLGPTLAVPLMLLAAYGLGGGSATIPMYIKPFMYMSYLRYSLEGLTIAMYGNDRAPMACPPQEAYCHFRHPKTLLVETSMEKANFWVSLVGLVGFYVVFRTLFYVLLRRRLSSRKSFPALNMVGQFVKTYLTLAPRV